jgi:DNA invertase Pin-like site-specific DNA recombinase
MDTKLTPERLQRKAIVYVRQSTPIQVLHHLESQRLQYSLPERARQLGFQEVEVIDEDQGRSGSGCVERPGFQRLVAQVCAGLVGGILCMEDSRLARNGRDWHTLLELCGWVGTVIIDPEGIYDPGLSSDRMVLGMKGTMSEFELNLIRQRSLQASQQKARRGELQFRLPPGFCWNANQVELVPDQRVQQVIRLIFQKMEELGSIRQVFVWLCQQKLQIPVSAVDRSVSWKAPSYTNLLSLFYNPFYAGAYAFGRTRKRTQVIEGRLRRSQENCWRQREHWQVLIRDHHPGYITWEQYEKNLKILEANAYMKSQAMPKAGRGGRALLAGLVRCRRCGRLLSVGYSGSGPQAARYICRGLPQFHPHSHVVFAGRPAEAQVVEQLLEAISGNAIEAALHAAEQERSQQGEHRRALELAWEQARYQARMAERRYEAVDPEQRWVASELEARWNGALEKVREAQARVAAFDQEMGQAQIPDADVLLSLAHDLPAVWETCTDQRLKQRIVHLVLREIVADVDAQKGEVILLLHWAGGRHSEVRWVKRRPRTACVTALEMIRKMAGEYSDQLIALTLNNCRVRDEEGVGGWSAKKVAEIRRQQKLPDYNAASKTDTVSVGRAAEQLQVSDFTVRQLIHRGILPAQQVMANAPWRIPVEALHSGPVQRALQQVGTRARKQFDEKQQLIFSDI